jgi:GAF domain-containing protein
MDGHGPVTCGSDAPATDPVNTHVAARFAELAIELHGATGLDETIETVVQFALQALECSHAGVVLSTKGARPAIAAVTDPLVADVYELQITDENGPLITSLRDRAAILVPDTVAENRWPRWAAKVAGLGVRSVLDVPLAGGRAGRPTVGVLGLYSSVPDAFGPDDQAVATILARHAMVAVATARHEQTMAEAVDARKLVGMAMGLLMERFDVDSDHAFAILKRHSQDTNTRLRDVARQLVDTRHLPPVA